jgi:hypothetical protein
MGLDMYLYAERYVWDREEAPVIEGHPVKVAQFSAGYWRKANAIHGWIVKNVAEGVDDCRPVNLDRDKAKELLALCQSLEALYEKDPKAAIKEARAKMPPTPGFFFGNYDIDEWYWQDIKETVKILSRALSDFADEAKYDFIYQASW